MKKTACLMFVFALAVLIVLPSIPGVNHPADLSKGAERALYADGWPLPPFPPNATQTLVADGWPLPPFPPNATQTLVADGWPLPPFPPNTVQTLVADGWPLPPFPPQLAGASIGV